MNSVNKNQALRPTLFKAQDKHSYQEVFFNTPQEAHAWMRSHKNWVLKKREIVKWSFPLGQVVAEECWVKVSS